MEIDAGKVGEICQTGKVGTMKWVWPRFFYLLDYITLSGILKCGDRKKNKNKN